MNQLTHRFGEAVRDQSLSDAKTGRLAGGMAVKAAARIMAAAIIATPYALAALGLLCLGLSFLSFFLIFWGVLLLAMAYFLLPRRAKNLEPTLRRAEAPALFRLLDDLTATLKTAPIDGIHVNPEVNAYITTFGGKDRVIGIGVPLWKALEPIERLAVLAHEVAHLANNDPARAHVTGRALGVLDDWFRLFTPPVLIDQANHVALEVPEHERSLLGEIVSAIFGKLFGGIAWVYEKLIYAQSQRAEYLADSLAASVSGRAGLQATLEKLILAPLAYDRIRSIHYDGSRHIPVFDLMAEAIAQPETEAAQTLRREAMEELAAVDKSHPPTKYRLEFLDALGEDAGSRKRLSVNWDRIDRELEPRFDEEEQRLLSFMVVQ